MIKAALLRPAPATRRGRRGLEATRAQRTPKVKALIKYFSEPCKPTKVNGGRTRNYPDDNLDKWRDYKAYNLTDVVVERAIDKALRTLRMAVGRTPQLPNGRGHKRQGHPGR